MCIISKVAEIQKVLEQVSDPEIPVLTLADMGIIRDIKVSDEAVEVIITPTYTGCPAMDMITVQIKLALAAEGFKQVKVTSVLSPAWTTDWITENGKRKLKEYGIAPPDKKIQIPADGVTCPQCGSNHTRLLSEFGSTACKALYQCQDCKEPFDYFKCH